MHLQIRLFEASISASHSRLLIELDTVCCSFPGQAKAVGTYGPAGSAPAAAEEEDDDDDVDLFGSDEEEETEEQKKIREDRLAMYAAKKQKSASYSPTHLMNTSLSKFPGYP